MGCKECNGRGYVPYRTPDGVYGWTTCMPCKGTGTINECRQEEKLMTFCEDATNLTVRKEILHTDDHVISITIGYVKGDGFTLMIDGASYITFAQLGAMNNCLAELISECDRIVYGRE